jgi:uncharacterized coiled-coil protein SlyX
MTIALRRPRRFRPLLAVALAGGGLGFVVGCASPTERELRREITRLEDRIDEQNNRIAAQQITIAQLREQLDEVRALQPEDLRHLVYPEKIVLASLTGGADFDDEPGDDGVVVYVQPVDRAGDVVKTAGELRVEVFDLSAPAGETLVTRCTYSPEELAEQWYSGMLTDHYTVRCPWQDSAPRSRELTVRAVFTDFLTQRVMTAQTVVEITPTPSDS